MISNPSRIAARCIGMFSLLVFSFAMAYPRALTKSNNVTSNARQPTPAISGMGRKQIGVARILASQDVFLGANAAQAVGCPRVLQCDRDEIEGWVIVGRSHQRQSALGGHVRRAEGLAVQHRNLGRFVFTFDRANGEACRELPGRDRRGERSFQMYNVVG